MLFEWAMACFDLYIPIEVLVWGQGKCPFEAVEEDKRNGTITSALAPWLPFELQFWILHPWSWKGISDTI